MVKRYQPRDRPGQRAINRLIGHGQQRVFISPPCARCGRVLMDRDGNPRWDIVGQLTFICQGGCPQPRAAR